MDAYGFDILLGRTTGEEDKAAREGKEHTITMEVTARFTGKMCGSECNYLIELEEGGYVCGLFVEYLGDDNGMQVKRCHKCMDAFCKETSETEESNDNP